MGVLLVLEQRAKQLCQGGQRLLFVLGVQRHQRRRPHVDRRSAIGTPRPNRGAAPL